MYLESILFLVNREARKLKCVKRSSHFEKIVNRAKTPPPCLTVEKKILTQCSLVSRRSRIYFFTKLIGMKAESALVEKKVIQTLSRSKDKNLTNYANFDAVKITDMINTGIMFDKRSQNI